MNKCYTALITPFTIMNDIDYTALDRLIEMDDKEDLLKRDLKRIDVRLPDRIIVQKGSE